MQPKTVESTPKKYTVIHYHYHYSPPNTNISPSSHTPLSRIKSDRQVKAGTLGSDKTETTSIPSQRSWKRFIKREFQSTVDPKERENPTLLSDKQKSSDPYCVSHQEPTTSKIISRTATFQGKINHTPNNQQKIYHNQYFSSPTPHAWRQQAQQTQLNPEIHNSNIAKQYSNASSTVQFGLLTERKPIIPQEKTYKYALLEEQCNFLRSKFLQHYLERHRSHQL